MAVIAVVAAVAVSNTFDSMENMLFSMPDSNEVIFRFLGFSVPWLVGWLVML